MMIEHEVENFNRKDVWSGTYRDVAFEVVRWFGLEDTEPISEAKRTKPIWNYYLFLREDQVPEDVRDKVILAPDAQPSPFGRGATYPYMESGILAGLEWPGGITYYDKRGGVDGDPIIAVAGCDYNHYWDQGHEHSYTVEHVLCDCKRTIDGLHEAIPNLLRRCSWNGKYVDGADGVVTKKGRFYSTEGYAAYLKACPNATDFIEDTPTTGG